MQMQRLGVVLTVVNLLLLSVIVTRDDRATAQTVTPLVRAGALELVDGAGQVRSRLDVEPDGQVVFRLVDQTGAIRVKLGAGADGSGLLLLDEDTEPGVHLIARKTGSSEAPATTSVTVHGPNGQERVIRPCRQSKRCGRR